MILSRDGNRLRSLVNLWPKFSPYVMSLSVRARQAVELSPRPTRVIPSRWRGYSDYVMSDWEVGNIDEELAVA